MNIHELNGKSICLLGFGQEGQTTFAALTKSAPDAKITIADSNPDLATPPGIALISGPDYLGQLEHFDVIIKSPGIPWQTQGKLKAKVTSATQIFFDSVAHATRIIGITGTKGKSTTASLIYQVLAGNGRRVFLAGNIGQPMLELLGDATPDTTFVLELSSYQLESLTSSPNIAVVTSFFPDHLDYHDGLKNYFDAKSNIAKFQTADDVVFYNATYPECKQIAELSAGEQVSFLPADFPGTAPKAMKGSQNTSNLAAAYKVALRCGVDKASALHALENAHGLPHRQESLGLRHGIEWINDSAATTPQSTVAAIQVLGTSVDTIIVGGLERGYDFTELGRTIAESQIPNVVIFPETGPKIRRAIEAIHAPHPKVFFETDKMVDAVQFAREHTLPGRAVLLSSASPSYNLYKNYPDRARAFIEAIDSLS